MLHTSEGSALKADPVELRLKNLPGRDPSNNKPFSSNHLRECYLLGRNASDGIGAIASGLLGARSYDGGVATAVLGVVLHFAIAFGAATTYYLASRKLPFLVTHAVVSGLAYGALVYLFMHLIVIRLSAVPLGSRHSSTKYVNSLNTGSASACRSLCRSAAIYNDCPLDVFESD